MSRVHSEFDLIDYPFNVTDLLKIPERYKTTLSLSDVDRGDLLSLNYYVCRSQVHVFCSKDTSEEFWSEVKVMRETALQRAKLLTYMNEIQDAAFWPRWLVEVLELTLPFLSNAGFDGNVERCDVIVVYDKNPVLSVSKQLDRYQIRVPVITRSYLNHFNSVVLEMSESLTQAELANVSELPPKDSVVTIKTLCQLALYPHLVFSLEKVPVIHYSSPRVCKFSYQVAILQLAFMILHEFAHVLLDHTKSGSRLKFENLPGRRQYFYRKKNPKEVDKVKYIISSAQLYLEDFEEVFEVDLRVEQEIEADRWALDQLIKIAPHDKVTVSFAALSCLAYTKLLTHAGQVAQEASPIRKKRSSSAIFQRINSMQYGLMRDYDLPDRSFVEAVMLEILERTSEELSRCGSTGIEGLVEDLK